GVVVLIHTPPLGFVSVGLTVMPQGPAVELYARPFVVKKPSVATYAGPLLQTHAWNAVISCGLKDPSPFPSVESIWRRRSRRFAGPSPANVLPAFKVRLRYAIRLFQSAVSWATVVPYRSCGCGCCVT